MVPTSSGEGLLKTESELSTWNINLDALVVYKDKLDGESGALWYASKSRLTTSYIEECES